MKRIESLERWAVTAVKLATAGYKLWQCQYDTSQPEGFHAWFWASGKTDIEIVTYTKAVQDTILRYRCPKE